MGDERDAFVARYSIGKTAGLFLAALGFVFGSLSSLGLFGESPFKSASTDGERMFLWFVVIFFSLGAAAVGRTFFDDRAIVLISQEGFYCRHRRKLIPWSAIRGFDIRRLYTGPVSFEFLRPRYLVFDVEPEFDADMSRSGVLSRDLHFGYSGYSDRIDTYMADMNLKEVVEAIKRYGPDHLGEGLD